MATSVRRKSMPKTAARAPAKAAVAAAKPVARSQARPAIVATKKEVAVTAGPTKKPAASKSAVLKPEVLKPAVSKPAVSKPAVSAKSVVEANESNTDANPVAPKAPKVRAVEKIKKAKLVRDSFTMPESEYAALGEVKKTCLKAGFEVKKSELLRIGVALVRKLALASLKQEVAALAPLKPGRPRKEKAA